MATYDFTVRYTGNAVETGRILICDLAPSLLAMAEAMKEIRNVINPAGEKVDLAIKATDKGSFVVDLILANGDDLFTTMVDLLTSKRSEALAQLITYLEVFGGVLAFAIAAYKRKIRKQDQISEGRAKITFDDGTEVKVPVDSLKACQNIVVRQTVNQTLAPLTRQGIDSIEFASAKTTTISVAKHNVVVFDVPEVTESFFEPTIANVYLKIITVAFTKGNKWKFSDGQLQFFATIEDDAFLDLVSENRLEFGASDTLKVRLRMSQRTVIGTGLRTDYVIEKVLEHVKGGQQIELEFE